MKALGRPHCSFPALKGACKKDVEGPDYGVCSDRTHQTCHQISCHVKSTLGTVFEEYFHDKAKLLYSFSTLSYEASRKAAVSHKDVHCRE